MIESILKRIEFIGEEDSDREEEQGGRNPAILWVTFQSGQQIGPCSLIDGVNSVDEESFDVTPSDQPFPNRSLTVVVIDQVAAIRMEYPERLLKAGEVAR